MVTTTHITTVLATIAASSCGALAAAFDPQTLPMIRAANFQSSDFVIDLNNANVQAVTDGRMVQFGDSSSFKVLALGDVDMAFARVTLDSGVVNPTHIHPRGAESLYLSRGTLEVTIAAELGNPTVYQNTLNAGQGTVFPRGLAHGEKCIDKDGCEFIAILNSSDPGSFGVTV